MQRCDKLIFDIRKWVCTFEYKFTTMPNKKQTSKRIATIASDLMRNSKNKNVRMVAASDLSQTKTGKKKITKKP